MEEWGGEGKVGKEDKKEWGGVGETGGEQWVGDWDGAMGRGRWRGAT